MRRPWAGSTGTASCDLLASGASDAKEASLNAMYKIELEPEERSELKAVVSRVNHKSRKVKRAQILLAADQSRANTAA